MIALICVLAVLGLGNCLEELPTRLEIESSINRTIDEVERMVKENPSLPRLSRSEIVNILHDITSKDMDSYENNVEKTREHYQRALMIVLPENSKNPMNEGLKNVNGKTSMVEKPSNSTETLRTLMEIPRTTVKTSNDLISTRTRNGEKDIVEKSEDRWKNHRNNYANVDVKLPTDEAILKLLNSDRDRQSAPEKFSFDINRFVKAKTNEESTKSKFLNTFGFRPTVTSKTDLEIVYSSSVTLKPSTKTFATTKINVNDFRPTMPPTVSSQNVLTFDQWHYNAPPSTTTSTEPRKSSTGNLSNEKKITRVRFVPTMITDSDSDHVNSSTTIGPATSTTPGMANLRDNKGSQWKNLRTMNDDEKPMTIFVTPMSSTSSGKFSGFIGDGRATEATKTGTPMREEVKDLLASIGLRPNSNKNDEKNKNKIIDDQDRIFGDNFKIPESNNLPIGQILRIAAANVESPSIINQNTFEHTPQDVKKGLNNLSPDVQLLFQRFGLQHSAKYRETTKIKTTTEKPRSTTSKTNYWNNFHPLPSSEIKDEGMKDFLAKFGLGTSDNRNPKATKTMRNVENDSSSMLDAVPGNMKKILETIGLIRTSHTPASNFLTTLKTTATPEFHVFKPHETSFDDEKQRTKINELLDKVKMVQEGKADASDVQLAAKQLLETAKSLKNGPDPLTLDEILKLYKNDVKNEIKRQQNPKELAEMAASENSDATSTTSTTTTTTTTTSAPMTSSNDPATSLDSSVASSDTAAASAESADSSSGLKNLEIAMETATTTEISNLEALADSFGGSTLAPDPVLPTKRKNGLYFLVDWNTFLEVGEDGNDKVNLRFQPKVGDRTRFISVAVP